MGGARGLAAGLLAGSRGDLPAARGVQAEA